MLHNLGLVFCVIYLTAVASTELAGNIYMVLFPLCGTSDYNSFAGSAKLKLVGTELLANCFSFFFFFLHSL